MNGSLKAILRASAAMALVAGAVFTPESTTAQASGIECGAFYRIKAGDTLRAITLRAYNHDRFFEVYDANRDVLADPARIEIGQLIYLPCAGSGPQSRAAALSENAVTPTAQDQLGTTQAGRIGGQGASLAQDTQIVSLPKPGSRSRAKARALAAEETQQPQVAAVTPEQPRVARTTQTLPKNEDVLMLSARGLEPLAGPDLPSGGLIGTLIERAFQAGGGKIRVDTAFVNDRPAHLDVLLPLGSFALGFPWPAPDCLGTQGQHTRSLCDRFEASLPIFQIEIKVLAKVGTEGASAGLGAKRDQQTICRPSGFPPVDLERQGVSRILVADDLDACLSLLRSGSATLVSVPAPMIRDQLKAEDVFEVVKLSSQEPVHALFSTKLAGSTKLRERLNAGLRKLQSSGEWFKIVSGYLTDYNSGRIARSR